MSKALPGFPAVPRHVITVDLDGDNYDVRFTWIERMGAWYFDLRRTSDDLEIVNGRRLSVGWTPIAGFPLVGAPDVIWYVRGPDAYTRDDLGGALRLVAFSRAEIVAPDPVELFSVTL